MRPLRLSVAVPLHDEEAVLPELLRRLGRVLDGIPGGPHEIVLVDDGSTDGTVDVIDQAVESDPRVVGVVLSRNFGHQAALSAGLDHVTGEAVVLMDGDLQDAPEAIPAFVAQYEAGYDVVYARRVGRKEPWWLRACYFVFYRLVARLSNVSLPVDAGDFGLISRRVIEILKRMPERHRYLRGLRSWVGFRQVGIDVERDDRHSGRSKYGLSRLFRLAGDAVFAFSIIPLRVAAILGGLAVLGSVLFAAYAVYARVVLEESPAGFTALTGIITFLSGTILLSLGIIGEYLGRVYEELKARPVYLVAAVKQRPAAGSLPPAASGTSRPHGR